MIDLYGVLQEQETVNGELGLGVDYYKGEQGIPGIPGKDGKDGSDQVYVGADEPTDERVKLWIDTDATPPSKVVSWDEIENKPEIPAPYTLPTASTSTLGGVKVDGNTITIADGVISTKGSSVSDTYIKDVEIDSYFGNLTFVKNDNTTVNYQFNTNWYDSYWMMTNETTNSDLYNAKEMIICWKNISGYTQMNYLIFSNGNSSQREYWSLGEYWSNKEIYLDSTDYAYISFDGTSLYTQNINEVVFIAYRVV